MQLHAQWNNILAADALHMQVPMTTLDLMDLSTSLPSPICEGATVLALRPPAVVAHRGSHTVGQEETSVLGDGASVLEDSTSVGRTVPLVLPTVEVPQRRKRTVMSMSLQRTLASKNQPIRGDSPSRRKGSGQSTIPQEPLSDVQQLSSECSNADARNCSKCVAAGRVIYHTPPLPSPAASQTRRSSRTSTAKPICYKEQPLNGYIIQSNCISIIGR